MSEDLEREQTEISCMVEEFLGHLSRKYGFNFSIVNMLELGQKLNKENTWVFSVLSGAEMEHFYNLRIPKNRLQWVAGRYAAKSALFKYKFRSRNIMDLKCIDVLKGENSAPFVLQYPDVKVSITHSFPFCIGVVSERKTGIDIEKVDEYPYSLIKHFFCEDEKGVINKKTDHYSQLEQSMIFWTRKEAVSKLLGLGMKMNFSDIDTSRDELWLGYPFNKSIILSSCLCKNFCLSLAQEQK